MSRSVHTNKMTRLKLEIWGTKRTLLMVSTPTIEYKEFLLHNKLHSKSTWLVQWLRFIIMYKVPVLTTINFLFIRICRKCLIGVVSQRPLNRNSKISRVSIGSLKVSVTSGRMVDPEILWSCTFFIISCHLK